MKSFADTGSALDDMSQRTGDTASNLSAIGYAAKQSGSDLESLEGGLSKMSGTIAGAIAGEKASVKLLDDLGLKASDLECKLPIEQLAMFADKIAGISDNDTKIDMVKSIFGKSGTALIPLLNEGSAGIGALTAEAEKLGLVMSDKDASAAAALGDSFDKLTGAAGAIVTKIGGALAPALSGIADYLTEVAAAVGKFVSENQGLVIGVGAAAVGLVALGVAVTGIGVVASVVGTAIGLLAGAVAFLASPIGIAVAAIGGILVGGNQLGFGMSYWIDLVGKLGISFGDSFGGIASTAKSTIGAVAEAFQAGNIESAMKIAWNGLKVLWQSGLDFLKSTWSRAILSLEDAFDGFGESVRHIWQDISNTLAQPMAFIIAKAQGLDPADVQQSLMEENKGQHGMIDKQMRDRQKERDQRRANLKVGDSNLLEQLKSDLQESIDAFQASKVSDTEKLKGMADKGKGGVQQAEQLGMQMKSAEAQAINSSGAASTIAKAANGSMLDQQLAEQKKANSLMVKNNKLLEDAKKKPGITIKEQT